MKTLGFRCTRLPGTRKKTHNRACSLCYPMHPRLKNGRKRSRREAKQQTQQSSW